VIGPVTAIGEGVAGALQARLAPMPAPMSELASPGAAGAVAQPGTAGFGTLLTRATRGLVDQVGEADRLQQLAATGQLADPTAAIIATQQASLSLDLAVQVRNRLVEGWQELSRMSV
jgi:flagellar hook-basal body complex protein FliE